jgi:acyl-CoA synthetase (AMP-forming)/AMP-acid ligase II
MELRYIDESTLRLEDLASAWNDSDTFVIVPAKTSVARDWVKASLNRIPAHLATGHFCLLSSGSTGAPKLIVGSKARAEELARTLHNVQDNEPVRETTLALPLSYSFAFVNQWVWSKVLHRNFVPTCGLSKPDRFGATLSQARDAMLCLAGPQAQLVLRLFDGDAFPGVIRLHFAGGRFPQETLADLARIFPNAQVFNNYGCVEAMPRLTVRRAEDGTDSFDIGMPIPGVELTATHASNLMFRSQYQAVAQVDPEGIHEFPDDGWLATGDMGESDADGKWRLAGRANEVFKRYGEKIMLSQVLTVVKQDWTGEAAVYREKDPAGEEGYVLVLSPSPTDTGLRTLLKAFRSSWRRAHWPLRIESSSSIPTLPNGKIDSCALQSLSGTTLEWRQRI